MKSQRKKINCRNCFNRGGSQLNHIKQLVEYITGMDTRIGYPNEHLAGNSDDELSSPLYATSVGLVMESLRNNLHSATPFVEMKKEEPVVVAKPAEQPVQNETVLEEEVQTTSQQEEPQKRRYDFNNLLGKIKEFLDNAE